MITISSSLVGRKVCVDKPDEPFVMPTFESDCDCVPMKPLEMVSGGRALSCHAIAMLLSWAAMLVARSDRICACLCLEACGFALRVAKNFVTVIPLLIVVVGAYFLVPRQIDINVNQSSSPPEMAPHRTVTEPALSQYVVANAKSVFDHFLVDGVSRVLSRVHWLSFPALPMLGYDMYQL